MSRPIVDRSNYWERQKHDHERVQTLLAQTETRIRQVERRVETPRRRWDDRFYRNLNRVDFAPNETHSHTIRYRDVPNMRGVPTILEKDYP